ncbi:MAG: N-6 DNA methylase [Acidimicrobiales bacterium]
MFGFAALADLKGDAFEGLLQKGAEDTKSGAGQYFTPRALTRAMIGCLQPKPGETIADPACGTGGFLLAAHEWIVDHHIAEMDADDKRFLRDEAVHGWEIVDGTARLCAMNLLLHGIGTPNGPSLVTVADALRADSGVRVDVVAANPPFGRKSSMTMVNEAGEAEREDLVIVRDDFWASTSNKQLNFLQHIKGMLKIGGRAAVVLPDNVLFEAGAGETIRRRVLAECDLHTILRLPTGIFYAQGVKANVVFFDRKPAAADPWTKVTWVYDLRTNKHFTLKTSPLRSADLADFVDCYQPDDRSKRVESERFRRFAYDELVTRDKANLDFTWLRDESLDDASTLPAPGVLAAEIAEELEAALAHFAELAASLPIEAPEEGKSS